MIKLSVVFNLRLTLPFKLGSTKGKEISSKTKKVIQLAKDISHKNKGLLLLGTLFIKACRTLKLDNVEIVGLIYNLVENEIFIPIPLEDLKKKYALYF